jgi:methionyl-tRNA formyltransferase
MINLYLLGEKGYLSLKSINSIFLSLIQCVIIGKDKNILNDYSSDIIKYCEEKRLNFIIQNKTLENNIVKYSIAIGWRWLIKDKSKLIVFHDSILPRLRGFNPLVTSLLNGDNEIGVTVLYGSDDFDRGELIIQKKININYPLKIKVAIESVSFLYGEAMNELLNQLKYGAIKSTKQDESLATYSLWRDEEDYIIDWSKSSDSIKRFIDAVGYPYKGAFTTCKGHKFYIKDSFVEGDVIVENRSPGKVLFKKENYFFIVCGSGLLCVEDFFDENGEKIEITNFRLKFK